MTDKETIKALKRVDKLRAELRQAEAELHKHITEFSKRRGYGVTLREYNVRSLLNLIKEAA